MKMRVISSRNEILSMNPKEKVVHFAFRPSNKDIFLLVESCPELEVIQLPSSYKKTVSKAIEIFLEMQKVQLFEGDVWGHRKDLNEYYVFPSSVLTKLKTLEEEGVSEEKITSKVAKEFKLNPKMVNYILESKQFS